MKKDDFVAFATKANECIKQEGIELLWYDNPVSDNIVEQSKFFIQLWSEIRSLGESRGWDYREGNENREREIHNIMIDNRVFFEFPSGTASHFCIGDSPIILSVCHARYSGLYDNEATILFCYFYQKGDKIGWHLETIMNVDMSHNVEKTNHLMLKWDNTPLYPVSFNFPYHMIDAIYESQQFGTTDDIFDKIDYCCEFVQVDGCCSTKSPFKWIYEDFLLNLHKFSLSGIYIISTQEKFIYIGQSKDISARWNNGHHRKQEIDFINQFSQCFVTMLSCPQDKLAEVERILINTLRPKLNKTKIMTMTNVVYQPRCLPSEILKFPSCEVTSIV
jgi:hypothetical protein